MRIKSGFGASGVLLAALGFLLLGKNAVNGRMGFRSLLALLAAAGVMSSYALAGSEQPHALPRGSTDRLDDFVGQPQVHLMYVIPSDGTDRRFDVNGTIVNSTDSWERWLAGQADGRRLRLDTFEKQLDITFVRLSESDAQISPTGAFVRDSVERQLHSLGFNAPNKIYAVFYDGSSTYACGGGAWPPTLPGNVAALYLKGAPNGTNCPDVYAGPGQPPGYRDYSMLHEIMHTLGFVPTCAPHHTLAGHTSDSNHDLMYAGSQPWLPDTLDVGHDDYYSAPVPGCLDLTESPYLQQAATSTTTSTTPGPGQPNIILPNPAITPGALNPKVRQSTLKTTICRSGWTGRIRPPVNYTNALKINQMVLYEETGSPSAYEEDHFIPLELGGAPKNPKNLWPEPRAQAKLSDPLETKLKGQVCKGIIKLAKARATIRLFKNTTG